MSRGRRLRYLGSLRYWLAPGMGVKRHVAWAALGAVLALLGAGAFGLWMLGDARGTVAGPIEDLLTGASWSRAGGWVAALVTVVGAGMGVAAIGRLNRSLLSNWMERPAEAAEVLHERLMLARGPRVVAIGGGTGLSRLLRGLRSHSSNLTAVVAVSDDGGSSGRLRSAFGMPAPGDLNDCLAALSVDEASLGRLLQYRFERGRELEGHTFGNLFIATLSEVEADFGNALRAIHRLLDLNGAVWPATAEAVSLRVEKVDGQVVEGESAVRAIAGPSRRVELRPADAEALPEVVAALAEADLVVLGPGSLFTSTLPPLLVPAVGEALRTTRGVVVQVINIMTEAGETDGYDAWDHVETLRGHLGRLPDLVVVNASPVDPDRIAAYRDEGADVVAFDPAPFQAAGVTVASWPLLAAGPQAQHDADAVARELVSWWTSRRRRHGPRRWAAVPMALLASLCLAQVVVDAAEPGLPPGLRPPTSPVFADAVWYDLVAVGWRDDGEPHLEIELGAVDPAGLGDFGMRQPIIEVYVDDGSGGATDLLPGSGLRMPVGDGWRYALRLTGDGAWWWRVDADGDGIASPLALPVEVDGRIVRVAWPVAVPTGARVYAISGVHDPFSADGWRPFADVPAPWAFAVDEPGPPVVDVLPGDAVTWQRMRSTGALQRADGPPWTAGAAGGWLWWLLMGLGMSMAVVGVAWRAWHPAAPATGAAVPSEPRPAGAAGDDLIADDEVAGVDDPAPPAAAAAAGPAAAPMRITVPALPTPSPDVDASAASAPVGDDPAMPAIAPTGARGQFSGEAVDEAAGSDASATVAGRADAPDGAVARTPVVEETPAGDAGSSSERPDAAAAAGTSESSIDAPNARSRSAKRS